MRFQQRPVLNAGWTFRHRKMRSSWVILQNPENSCTIPAVINAEQIPRVAKHLQLRFPKKRPLHNYFQDLGNLLSASIKTNKLSLPIPVSVWRGHFCAGTQDLWAPLPIPIVFGGTDEFVAIQPSQKCCSVARQRLWWFLMPTIRCFKVFFSP